MACIYMTIAGLSCIYFLGDDALDIGTFSAFLLLLIGVIEAYDYIDNRRGSLGEIAECSAMVLCSIGYFHHMLAHIKQTQKLKELQYYKDRCKFLENKNREVSEESCTYQKRYSTLLKVTQRNNKKYEKLLHEYEELKQQSESNQ